MSNRRIATVSLSSVALIGSVALVAFIAVVAVACKSKAKKDHEPRPTTVEPEPTAVTPEAPPINGPTFRLGDEVAPEAYKAELNIDPNSEVFSGTIEISVDVAKAGKTIWMHGRGLTIESAEIVAGGSTQKAEPIVREKNHLLGLRTANEIPVGKATVRVTYSGKIVRRDGYGVFAEKEGDHWYVFTQFESLYARMAFPCFDEPRWKVPWTLSLRVAEDQVAVSNTPVVSETKDGKGKKLVVFETTKKLPSYLVAFGVGPFEFVDAGKSRNGVPMRVVVPAGRSAEAKYAAKVTPEILERLEDYFGIPYPYRKLDTLVIPSTQGFGAMEHPGLITFASSLTLWKADQATFARERSFALIQAHEIGHQWFGNLVTMPWWDDIWLNEAFASWIENRSLAAWRPSWKLETVAMSAKEEAMDSDLLGSARKIREPVDNEDGVNAAFDSITYEKGQSVINMFETWVGPKVWQKGIKTYLEKYEWSTATAADLLAVVGEVSGRDVATPFNTFLEQNGIPEIEVTLVCEDGKAPMVKLSQSRYLPTGSKASSARKWKLPVCMTFDGGDTCVELTEKEMTADLEKPSMKCPTWLNPNKNGVGYYRSRLPAEQTKSLLAASSKLSLAEQLSFLGDIDAMLQGGTMMAADALPVVSRFANSKEPSLVATAISLAYRLDTAIENPAIQTKFNAWVRQEFTPLIKRIGLSQKNQESPHITSLRPKALRLLARAGAPTVLAFAKKGAAAHLAGAKRLDATVVRSILSIAAASGDEALLTSLIRATKAADNKIDLRNYLSALGKFEDATLASKAFAFAISGDVDARDGLHVLRGAAIEDNTRLGALEFIFANYTKLADGMSEAQLSRIPARFAEVCDQQMRNKMAAFFAERAAKIPGGEQTLKQSIERIDLCIAFRAAQKKSLADGLASAK